MDEGDVVGGIEIVDSGPLSEIFDFENRFGTGDHPLTDNEDHVPKKHHWDDLDIDYVENTGFRFVAGILECNLLNFHQV